MHTEQGHSLTFKFVDRDTDMCGADLNGRNTFSIDVVSHDRSNHLFSLPLKAEHAMPRNATI